MWDDIDWAAVAIWSVFIAIQVSSAIEEWWKKKDDGEPISEEEERRIIADRERRKFELGRIMGGKKVDGWKSTVKSRSMIYDPHERFCQDWSDTFFSLLLPPWPKEGNEAKVDTSVLVLLDQRRCERSGDDTPLPLVQQRVIRRYSLIAPGVYDDIVHIPIKSINHGGWWPGRPVIETYVSENILALGWQRKDSDEIRIALIDIEKKLYQLIKTTSPHVNANIEACIYKDPDPDRLSVLFRVGGGHLDNVGSSFYMVDYEITPTENVQSPIALQEATRQLDWPDGRWQLTQGLGTFNQFPGVYCLCDNVDAIDARIVWFDRFGIHDLDNAIDWVDKFTTTALGSRMIEIDKSLNNLLPADFEMLRFKMHRSHLFVGGCTKPYVHHPHSMPSLLYLAADAFCSANPDFDFARLKPVIGRDIFDGIFDGKPPCVIPIQG